MQNKTAERLKMIMEKKHLRQTDVLRMAEPYCQKYRIKLNKSDLSQFVNGKVTPGDWKLTILGLTLDVSEAWLMGFDVPMERSVTPTADMGDGRTQEYVDLFSMLDAYKQTLVINLIKGLLSEK